MSLVWLRCRVELRANWRATVVSAILLGIGGGIALTALAGARRTDTALAQFVSYSLPDDGGYLTGSLSSPPVTPGTPPTSLDLTPLEQRIADLPQVAAYSRAPYLYLTTRREGNEASDLTVIGAANADLLHSMDRPMVLSGHLPSPTQPFEAAVNDLAAQADHLRVGSRVHLYAYSAAQVASGALTGAVQQVPVPRGPAFTVRVAAIVRLPQDVSAVAPLEARSGVFYEGDRNLYVTPAFLPRLAGRLGIAIQQIPDINLVAVRLRHGAADWATFAEAAMVIGGNQIFVSHGNVYRIHTAASSTQRGIHLVVVALILFGALAALVTLALVGQAVGREIVLAADDYDRLRVLGATRVQMMGSALVRPVLIAGTGGFAGPPRRGARVAGDAARPLPTSGHPSWLFL